MTTYKVHRFAGSGIPGNEPGNRLSHSFASINGICVDKKGDVYVVDNIQYNGQGTAWMIRGNQVTSLCPKEKQSGLSFPIGILVGEDGIVYISDTNKLVSKIMEGGELIQIAAATPGDCPAGIIEAEPGVFYVTCQITGSIKKVTKEGTVTTLASNLKHPFGITKDSAGNLTWQSTGGTAFRKWIDWGMSPLFWQLALYNVQLLLFLISLETCWLANMRLEISREYLLMGISRLFPSWIKMGNLTHSPSRLIWQWMPLEST